MEDKKDTPIGFEQTTSQDVSDEDNKPPVKMQHVMITLADGRRGVFMGPELIQEIEMKLNAVPRLVSVDFDPPRAVAVPIPRPQPKEEKKDDKKIVDEPTNDLGKKA